MSEQVLIEKKKHGLIIQFLWFFFIGWWLGAIWNFIAWIFIISIILMPIGFKMINMIPKVMLLREKEIISIKNIGNTVFVTEQKEKPQKPFILRALWFIFIGWWLSGIWMNIAYFFCMLIITFPIGAKMFELVPFITTLKNQ